MTYQTFPTPLTAGDTLPAIVGAFPFDITGYTLLFRMKRPSDVLQKNATIAVGTAGAFTVPWAVGDLVAGVMQLCELRLIDTIGQEITSQKFFITVAPRI